MLLNYVLLSNVDIRTSPVYFRLIQWRLIVTNIQFAGCCIETCSSIVASYRRQQDNCSYNKRCKPDKYTSKQIDKKLLTRIVPVDEYNFYALVHLVNVTILYSNIRIFELLIVIISSYPSYVIILVKTAGRIVLTAVKTMLCEY